MNVTFDKAKNGETTALYNNITLHSSYNPTREAERFVSNINVPYNPPLIILLEPAVSYITPLIKNKYPNSKIAIIRYTSDFEKFNSFADYVINFKEYQNDFSSVLYNTFGEELLLTAIFVQWEPSSKAFSEIDKEVSKHIKEVLEKSKTLLVTREYFEKKWFLNTVNFIRYAKNIIKLNNKITSPILLISSGPSLNNCLQIIKENKEKFFIICLSSSISVLLKNNITPDLCITSDGGFWAGQHIKRLNKYNIPIAVPLEGYIQKSLLENKQILPLSYNDGLSSQLVYKLNYPTMSAERNGTVSGTALCFALENSTSDIYFCGLDMCNQKGYQHTEPNENELNNSINDNRLHTKERRMTISQYSKGVMFIYKEWFDSLSLNNRKVYRIIDKEYKNNSLGEIKNISSYDFKNIITKYNEYNNDNIFTSLSYKYDTKAFYSYIKNSINSEEWQKKLYPLSYTALTHNENNTDIISRINKDNFNLLKKIGKVFDE